MMALPATVLEAEAVVSTASAGACTLTSGDAGTSRPRRLSHLPAPVARSRGGLRQMVRAGQRVRLLPLASASPRRSETEYHFSLVRTLLRSCSLKG